MSGRRVSAWLVAALGFACAQPAKAATDYLPGQAWSTYSDGAFQYHFTADGAPWVGRLAAIGARAFPILADWTGYTPKHTVHVVVIVDNDFANGSATPLPRNTIRIYPIEPRHPSFLSEYGDWLSLLFVHELLHIFHLDMHAMPTTIFRKIFGRQYLYSVLRPDFGEIPMYLGFPNAALPDTLIEGYAVWAEGLFGGGLGRGNGPLSLSLRRNAAREDALPSLGEAVGLRRDFPGGNGSRIYGGAFHAYLDERQTDPWPELYGLYARGVFPYLWGLAGIVAFDGERPMSLWQDWLAYERFHVDQFDRFYQKHNAGRPIAGPFISARAPRWAANGDIYLAIGDGTHHDRIVRLSGNDMQTVAQRHGGTGLAIVGNGLIFDENVRVKDTAIVSRLVQWQGKKTDRFGPPHSFEPHVAAGKAVWVHRLGAQYCLEVVSWPDLAPIQRHCAPTLHTLHDPVLSPDGQKVAFVEWRPGTRHDLKLWPLAETGSVDLASFDGDETLPRWSDDGARVYFVSTYTGAPELFHVEVSTLTRFQNTRTPTGVWQFDVSGNDVIYLAPLGSGWHLFQTELSAAPLTAAAWQTIPDRRSIVQVSAETEFAHDVTDAEPYRAWKTLWPTGWTPALQLGSGRQGKAGFQIGSQDVLARWAWGARLLLNWNDSLDWHGLPEVAYGIGYNQGRWYVNASGQIEPRNRLEILDDQRAIVRRYAERHELGAARIWRRIDIAHALRIHMAEEHVIGGTKSFYEFGGQALHDSRKSYAWSLVPGDGLYVKLLAAGDDGADRFQPDGRLELLTATGGFLFKRVQWHIQGAAGLDLRKRGRTAFSLHGPANASSSARHFTGRGVPTTEATLQTGEYCPDATICAVDRFGLWEAETIWPLWWIQAGPGAAPFYFDQINLRTFVAGAHFRRETVLGRNNAQQLYGGAEVQLGMIFGWASMVGPLTFGVRWPLLSDYDPVPDYYLYYGLNFDRFGSFVRPPAPESF